MINGAPELGSYFTPGGSLVVCILREKVSRNGVRRLVGGIGQLRVTAIEITDDTSGETVWRVVVDRQRFHGRREPIPSGRFQRTSAGPEGE